jgi:mono/diheme cytochrome c family protein
MTRGRVTALVMPIAGLMLLAGTAAAQGEVERGRGLAIKHCARCHVVADYNPFGGIGSTASFQTMARMRDYRERFQTFYARPPHPVFVRVPGVDPPTNLPSPVDTIAIQPDDVDHILAYVETLRRP